MNIRGTQYIDFDDKDYSIFNDIKKYNLAEHQKWLLSRKKAKDVNTEDDLPEYGYCDLKAAEENDQEMVVLASDGRSGNTFTRGYLEKITGITTGSTSVLH